MPKVNSKESSISNGIRELKTERFIHTAVIFGLAAAFAGLILLIANKVNQIQPEPYLDEIYHIPQALEYCQGNFSHWDDRITTLPGLYLLSIGVLNPLSNWIGQQMCDTNNLRSTNIVLSLCNFFLYIWITQKLHIKHQAFSQGKRILSALNIALFPPLFFFAFLYYTDVGAAFLVFLMYSLHLDGKNVLAALTGIAAILMRQTSIVWAILVAMSCLDLALQNNLFTKKELKQEDLVSTPKQIVMVIKRLLSLSPFTRKIGLMLHLILELLAYILVGLLFAAFVFINEGLVVGDRSAHQATVNVPQFFYFFGLVTLFAAPHWLSQIQPFLKACFKRPIVVGLIVLITVLIIRYNTIVHPYLLADNRHYTFYIWKRVYEYHPLGRYLVIPFYLFGAYVTYNTMTKMSFIFACSFLLCSFIALVPQRLLEIRYFFIPFLLLRLHIPPRSWIALLLESVAYLSINAATLYLFLYRPFYWQDSPLVQRFMW